MNIFYRTSFTLFSPAVVSTLFFVFGASADVTSKKCVDEFCFATVTKVGDRILPLIGIGQVRYLGFLGYTAALYAPADVTSTQQTLSSVPKKLIIDYYRTIEPSAFVKSSEKFMRENKNNNWALIEPGFIEMNKLYDTVHRGDRYEISFDPQTGLTLALNGITKGTVANPDFAKAYLGIWLSDYPISNSLKDELLGR